MNLKTVAFYGMIALIFILALYVLFWTKSEGFVCLSNPYNYSINLLEKSNNAAVSCVCSVLKPDGLAVRLDNTGFHRIE